MIFFPNLLGQLGSMEFRGSYGKISRVGDLKSRLKWYMEGVWGVFVNKPLGFQERFNSTFGFESSFKYSFESLKYMAYIETSGIM